MSAPHPADVIASEGAQIRLMDGSTVTIRFSMGNLRLIERRYGSLGGFSKSVEALQPDKDATPEEQAARPVFDPLVDVLSCIMPAGPLRDPDQLAEQITPRYLNDYMAALQTAMAEAFPKAEADVPAVDGPGNVPALDAGLLAAAQQHQTAPQVWTPQPE